MGRQQLFAVETEGVEDYVLKRYKENAPATKISKELKQNQNVDVSALSINRWLKKQREEDTKSVAKESNEKFKKIALDYEKELKTVLDEIKEIKQQAIDAGKLNTYAKLVGKIYDGINLFAKIRGDIQQTPQGTDINIIINQINKETFKENKDVKDELHTPETIDVEAEIIDEDKQEEEKLKKK